MNIFFSPQYSADTFVLPVCFRFVRNGTASFKGGRIENCDFVSIEALCFRIVIGVIK